MLRGSETPSIAEVVMSFREAVRRFSMVVGDIFHILVSSDDGGKDEVEV